MGKAALTHTDTTGELADAEWWAAVSGAAEIVQPFTAHDHDTVSAKADLASLYELAEIDDDFAYGPSQSRVDFYVPPLGSYTGAAVPVRSALRFIDQTKDYLTRSEAAGFIERILDLLESPEPNGRITLVEDDPDEWRAPGSRMPDLLEALWKLYGVDPDRDMIRDDGADIYGTKAWLAFSGTQTFVLSLRSEFVEVPDGEPTIVRLLEAVKVSGNDDVWEEVLLPSPAEVLRIEVLLDRYDATLEEQEYVRYYANRYTVQRDADVWGLLLRYRRQSRPLLSVDAQNALWKVIAPNMARVNSAVADAT